MRDVGEERRDLTLRVVGGPHRPELLVRPQRVEERAAGVEALAGAGGGCLIGDAVEERVGHDVRHGHAVAAGSGEARPRLAAAAAVVVGAAAVAPLAAAQVRRAAAALAGDMSRRREEEYCSER